MPGERANAPSLFRRQFRKEDNRLIAAGGNFSGIHDYSRDWSALEPQARMPPREAQKKFRQRLESPGTFEGGAAFFDMVAEPVP